MLFNASKAYIGQLGRGWQYEALEPVYAPRLVNEIFELTSPNFYHHYRFVHTAEPERHRKGLELILELIFVELLKFQPDTLLAKWDSISSERTLIADAIREGLAISKAQGLAKGIARGQQQQAQARRMRARGFSLTTIQEITGLSAAEPATPGS